MTSERIAEENGLGSLTGKVFATGEVANLFLQVKSSAGVDHKKLQYRLQRKLSPRLRDNAAVRVHTKCLHNDSIEISLSAFGPIPNGRLWSLMSFGESSGQRLGRLIAKAMDAAVSSVEEETVVYTTSWRLGDALTIVDHDEKNLEEAEHRLRNRIKTSNELLRWGFIVTVVFLVLLGTALLVHPHGRLAQVYPGLEFFLLFYGLLSLVLGVLGRVTVSDVRSEVQELRNEVEIDELAGEKPHIRRAQKVFQKHSLELKRYYDQALRQRALIFATGIISLVLGFTIIGIALYLLVSNRVVTDSQSRILIAVLGAVGGILGNFIALVYLKMFSDTLNSIGGYHDRLVTTHHLHFANVLVANMQDAVKADDALSRLVSSAARHGTSQENRRSNANH
ncbi:MAG: hypothetical protein QOF66_1314 [Mycobacterium sp.]|jgi:hypothetical protein|uniref:TRADD-N-associated membrane domain-containing protein n=1 Tax=Mycobacterium sp. TaxID=1785 RepID=UPI0028B6B7B3|nr:hypothetical protein [Mycobacterium sp.]